MIFQHTHEWIFAPSPHTGELKTQTSRIVKPGDFENHWHLGGDDDLTLNEVCRGARGVYTVGKTYAVQPGRGKPSIGRVRITNIRREDRREISQEDARAEGFASPMGFLQTWVQMRDKSAYALVERWFIRADIDGRGYGYPMPTDIQELLSRRPAERYDAWVLTFEAVKP